MNRFGMLFSMAVVLLCAGFVSPVFAQVDVEPAAPAAVEPPVLEDYVYSGQAEQYAREGWAFVNAHPESNFSPGIVANILMLGQLAGNDTLVAEMRRVLLFNYPRSVHAQHLMKVYPSDSSFRTALSEDLKKDFLARPTGFVQRLTQLLRVAIKQRGSRVMDDDQLLLIAAVAADLAEDQEVADAMLRSNRQREAKGELGDIKAIVLDAKLSESEKVRALTPYLSNSTSRLVLRMLLVSMSEDERLTPEVLRPTVAVVLFDRRFSDALNLLDRIPEDVRTDRDLFWIGWAQASLGKNDLAAAAFNTLTESFPDSAWTKAGSQMQGYLQDDETRLRTYGEIISGVVRSFDTGATAIELKGTSAKDDGAESFSVYIGAIAGKRMELQLRRGEQVVLAYRDSVTSASLLNEGSTTITKFDKGGLLPEITLALVGNPTGGFSLQTGFRVGDNAEQQKRYLSDLVSSPYLSNTEGVMDLTRYQRTQGRFVIPVTEHGKSIVIGWAAPEILEPKVNISTMTMTEGRLTALRFGALRLDGIRYSGSADMELTPPAWPDLESVQRPQIVFTTALQIYGEFVRLLTQDPGVNP